LSCFSRCTLHRDYIAHYRKATGMAGISPRTARVAA